MTCCDKMTHMIFAGYESAEEMENWTDYYTTQPAWGEYLQSLQGVVTWLSTELVQNALVFDGKMDVETFTKWERTLPWATLNCACLMRVQLTTRIKC